MSRAYSPDAVVADANQLLQGSLRWPASPSSRTCSGVTPWSLALTSSSIVSDA